MRLNSAGLVPRAEVPGVPLARATANVEVDATLVGLVNVGSIPEHLDGAVALGVALGGKVTRDRDLEVLLAIGDGGTRRGVGVLPRMLDADMVKSMPRGNYVPIA